ncbi:MAG: hypothetical protein ACODAC_09570 [Pseudomonadota bacterium]
MNAVVSTTAVVAGFGAVACAFAAWRNQRRQRPGALAALALLALSGWLWVAAAGAEFGITLALLVTPVLALGFVAANRTRRPRRGSGTGAAKPNGTSQAWPRHLLLFLVAGPAAGLASALVAVAASLLLPVAPVNAMIAVIIVMPVLWGGAGYWVCADPMLLRPAAVLALGAAVGAAVIYL